MSKPGNPGHMCCHITFMRLARIQWVKTVPSRIRVASSNPAHAPHRGSCAQPVSGLHACWRDHTAAAEIPTDRRSGRRGNRRSYHAPAIKGGAGEPSSSSAPLPPCLLRSKKKRRRAVRNLSRRNAAAPELKPDLRRRTRWAILSPPSSANLPVSSPSHHEHAPAPPRH